MSFKESIERNPFIYLMASGVSVAALVAAVVSYLAGVKMEQQSAIHQLEKAALVSRYEDMLDNQSYEYKLRTLEFKDRLAAIERRMGEDEDNVFDVRKIRVPITKIAKALPEKSDYFQGEQFYALKPQPKGKWVYGVEVQSLDLDEDGEPEITWPAHRWRRKISYIVRYPGGEKVLVPSVTVTRVSLEEAAGIIAASTKIMWFSNILQYSRSKADVNDLIGKMENQLAFLGHLQQTDPVGLLFTSELIDMTRPPIAARERTVLSHLERNRDVAYAKLKTTFGDVKYFQKRTQTDGNQEGSELYAKEFYRHRELIIVLTDTHIYQVDIDLPTPDNKNNEDMAWVDGWLLGFAVPVEE